MNFSFSLLRIKSLYMFRALLAFPQEALKLQSWHSQLTLHARNIPSAVCAAPPEKEQVMLETCRGSWFSINRMKSASRWFHYADVLDVSISKLGPEFIRQFRSFSLQTCCSSITQQSVIKEYRSNQDILSPNLKWRNSSKTLIKYRVRIRELLMKWSWPATRHSDDPWNIATQLMPK
jgi:hypothetical protein